MENIFLDALYMIMYDIHRSGMGKVSKYALAQQMDILRIAA